MEAFSVVEKILAFLMVLTLTFLFMQILEADVRGVFKIYFSNFTTGLLFKSLFKVDLHTLNI